MCKRWIYLILLYCWVVYVSQCIFICFCFPHLSFVDYSEQDCSLMYCTCFLYFLSLCVVCHYTAYTLPFLLFFTVLYLVSFTCIIVVFSLLFFYFLRCAKLCASVLHVWFKYCGVLLLLLVCLLPAVCVFVLLLMCILLMHFSTFCAFDFSTFILIFILFILIDTYF